MFLCFFCAAFLSLKSCLHKKVYSHKLCCTPQPPSPGAFCTGPPGSPSWPGWAGGAGGEHSSGAARGQGAGEGAGGHSRLRDWSGPWLRSPTRRPGRSPRLPTRRPGPSLAMKPSSYMRSSGIEHKDEEPTKSTG